MYIFELLAILLCNNLLLFIVWLYKSMKNVVCRKKEIKKDQETGRAYTQAQPSDARKLPAFFSPKITSKDHIVPKLVQKQKLFVVVKSEYKTILYSC